MNALREAAQQALEFIEATNKSSSMRLVPDSNLNKAITALRAALAAPPDAEIEALRREAGRYRYLRNRDPAEVLSKEGKDAGCWIDCEEKDGITYHLQLLTGDDADAAIDAAMKEDKT